MHVQSTRSGMISYDAPVTLVHDRLSFESATLPRLNVEQITLLIVIVGGLHAIRPGLSRLHTVGSHCCLGLAQVVLLLRMQMIERVLLDRKDMFVL